MKISPTLAMQLLTRLGYLIEEDGITYLARTDHADSDNVLAPLQAASSERSPDETKCNPGFSNRW